MKKVKGRKKKRNEWMGAAEARSQTFLTRTLFRQGSLFAVAFEIRPTRTTSHPRQAATNSDFFHRSILSQAFQVPQDKYLWDYWIVIFLLKSNLKAWKACWLSKIFLHAARPQGLQIKAFPTKVARKALVLLLAVGNANVPSPYLYLLRVLLWSSNLIFIKPSAFL